MTQLKNVKISHDERRDIAYVENIAVVDKMPKIGDDYDYMVVMGISRFYVDISETRQEDYDFYEIDLFNEKSYKEDCDYNGSTIDIDKKDYTYFKIVAIKKEQK